MCIRDRYSHVMHLTSQVSGELTEGTTSIDVLRATLPAGTVSGAPKVRAMEIIDQLEPVKRGPYAGVVGYFYFEWNNGHRYLSFWKCRERVILDAIS